MMTMVAMIDDADPQQPGTLNLGNSLHARDVMIADGAEVYATAPAAQIRVSVSGELTTHTHIRREKNIIPSI